MKYLLTLFLIFSFACTSQDDYSQKTVVKVDNIEMSTKEFSDILSRKIKNHDSLSAKDPANLNRIKENIISDFIVDCIVSIWAKEKNVSVSKEELSNKVRELRENYPDDNPLRRVLAQENLSLEKWQDLIEKQLLKEKLFEFLGKQIEEPTDSEIKEFYKKNENLFKRKAAVKLRQIVLKKESDARRIEKELKKGKSFKELASKFSENLHEAENEGETDWIEKGVLEVFDKAFTMRVGRRSAVLKSPYGFHIYQVLKKQKAGNLSLNDAKDKIRRLLKAEKEKTLYTSWLEERVRKTRVFRDDELIDAVFVQTKGS